MTLVGSLRLYATPEPVSHISDFPSTSGSPSAARKMEGPIPFISVGDAEGGEWPQPVSMTKEAQEFIANVEGPICVLVCMGNYGTEQVSFCATFCVSLVLLWTTHFHTQTHTHTTQMHKRKPTHTHARMQTPRPVWISRRASLGASQSDIC